MLATRRQYSLGQGPLLYAIEAMNRISLVGGYVRSVKEQRRRSGTPQALLTCAHLPPYRYTFLFLINDVEDLTTFSRGKKAEPIERRRLHWQPTSTTLRIERPKPGTLVIITTSCDDNHLGFYARVKE